MSETHYLVCHEHKELIWIGQGNTFEEFNLYNDGMLDKFFYRHEGCNLKFERSNDLHEIEKIKFGEKVTGVLLGFPVYLEYEHPSQIKDDLSDLEPKLKEKILKASNVYKIRWDENNLFVHFNNGGVYQYKDIPESVSIGMSEAESPGSYLHLEIKGKYRYEKV